MTAFKSTGLVWVQPKISEIFFFFITYFSCQRITWKERDAEEIHFWNLSIHSIKMVRHSRPKTPPLPVWESAIPRHLPK